MVMRKWICYTAITIATVILTVTALQASVRYSIDQYLEQKKIYITDPASLQDGRSISGYAIPNSRLRWLITGLEDMQKMNHSGMEPILTNSIYAADEMGHQLRLSDFMNGDGTLKQGFSLVAVDVIIMAEEPEGLDIEPLESWYILPADFLKLANKRVVDSFLHPVLPATVIRAGRPIAMDDMYFVPGTSEEIQMIFLLDKTTTLDNGVLFSSVLPTQTANVCLELQDYI